MTPSPFDPLVDDTTLASSSVVANNAMNRGRGLESYRRELGIDPIAEVRNNGWLDLCCGEARALIDAAGLVGGAPLVGVDLVEFFRPAPPGVDLRVASLSHFHTDQRFDLITCVHGLHYVGDRLGLLARAASWLAGGGLLVADFDAAAVCGPNGKPLGRALLAALREAGFDYDGRRRRVSKRGPAAVNFPFTYLGADPAAGPNYTGQNAVHAHYERCG
ncbi:class I SAM-dependent methyltransferase [Actinokineospora sp. HUAS TT18]|uniref:class I SAM-dependent methyltransferase n=1 Tax=Actinokineospora sp. HUAS TT18 TaxID=3447451 RepID=UPI003F52045A